MLSNLRVSTRLSILVGLLVLVAIAVGVFGVSGMSGTVAGLKTVYEDRTVPLLHLAQVRQNLNRVQMEMLLAVQHIPGSEIAKVHDHPLQVHFDNIDKILKEIDTEWKVYVATDLKPEDKALALEFEARYKSFVGDYVGPSVAAFRGGDFSLPAIGQSLKRRFSVAVPTVLAVQKLADLQERAAKEEYAKAVASYERTRTIAIALNVAGLLLAGLLTWAISRSLVTPLNSMREAIVGAGRDGDFTRRASVRGTDEVGTTATAFNGLMQTLQQAFGQIRDNVVELNLAAKGVAQASKQAAAGSNDASEAAASMAASVEEMTVSVTHIADNAREAAVISGDSGKQAEQGGRIIADTTGEIHNIAATVNQSAQIITQLGEQSGRISSIVKVIKEVADRTNLLALNAAIEAARAGEQGRGFAVVADEVRKLAERTTTSTAEISGMVDAIQRTTDQAVVIMQGTVGKVSAGVALAESAEHAIGEIHQSAGKVVQVVADMSAALAEQSSAANSIARQVERVAQAADQGSAAARGTADSAQLLEQLASRMQQSLARFTV